MNIETLDLLRAYESRNVTFIEPDGSWPIVWKRAKGVQVWDAGGERYLDLTAAFGVQALSFRMRAMKPDPRVYIRATELAATQPRHVFFTDDRPEHVAAAGAAGWDAVQFETAWQLNDELRRRGVRVNY